jgi:hypothetical protein
MQIVARLLFQIRVEKFNAKNLSHDGMLRLEAVVLYLFPILMLLGRFLLCFAGYASCIRVWLKVMRQSSGFILDEMRDLFSSSINHATSRRNHGLILQKNDEAVFETRRIHGRNPKQVLNFLQLQLRKGEACTSKIKIRFCLRVSKPERRHYLIPKFKSH